MCCVKFARFVLLILLVSINFSKADNLDKRKNVLVMIGDDVGFQSQVYNNTVCRTPNLNAFAKRSVTFRNGFTSVSSCSPSRSAILTGTKIGSVSYLWVRLFATKLTYAYVSPCWRFAFKIGTQCVRVSTRKNVDIHEPAFL